jgi:hypothetical protein
VLLATTVTVHPSKTYFPHKTKFELPLTTKFMVIYFLLFFAFFPLSGIF